MHAANASKSYRHTTTLTAPPGQVVLMLLAGAIRFLEQGLAGFSSTDPRELNMTVNNNFQRALEVIRQLDLALDLEKGGKLATTLHRLYDYFDQRIRESNVKKKREGAEEVVRHLIEIHDAWATMLRNPQGPPDHAPESELEAA